jgi:hypothetical protein
LGARSTAEVHRQTTHLVLPPEPPR